MNMIYIYILNESSLHNYKLLHLYIVSYIELMRSYKIMTCTMSHQQTLITLVRPVVTKFGPRCEKTCLRGFRQSQIQTSLLI